MPHVTLKPVAEGPFALVRFADGALTVNGKAVGMSDGKAVVEYSEREKYAIVSSDPSLEVTVIPSAWVDPTPPPEPDLEAEAAAQLDAERQSMTAKKWQLRSVLGPSGWAVVEMLLTDPKAILGFDLDEQAAWDLRCLVEDIDDIPRVSETVDLLAYAFRMSDLEADELFRQAVAKRK